MLLKQAEGQKTQAVREGDDEELVDYGDSEKDAGAMEPGEDEQQDEDSDEFSRRMGLSTQAIEELNAKVAAEMEEGVEGNNEMDSLETCEEKWKREEEEKTKKQQQKGGGKQMGKSKAAQEGEERRRRRCRVGTDQHTMEKAENLVKQKNLETGIW